MKLDLTPFGDPSGKEARPGCYGARPDPKLGMGVEKG